MKTKFTKTILYGYLVIFTIISISSLGYYVDSLNSTTILVCRNNCDDKFIELEKNTTLDKIKIQQISKSEVLSKGIGFNLPEDIFTQEDLKQLQQKEKELNTIADDPDTLEEKRRKIHLDIQDMQDRLQYPFQTGVPYHLVKMLQEKYSVFKEHRSDLKGEVWVTLSGSDIISHTHHALRLGINPDHFTLYELESQDKKIREYLGNEMNILYEPALGQIPLDETMSNDFSSQECADLFDKVLREFRDTPCECCNAAPGEVVCEPIGVDSVIASSVEFRDSGCEYTYKDWVNLTSDSYTASWVLYPGQFKIDMLKVNFSKEIPIAVTYTGYDECLSFQLVVRDHEGLGRPVVAERFYENVCSENVQDKEYRLPKYVVELTEHGESISLSKGNYYLFLYNVENEEKVDEETDHNGQFYFSSHYDDKASVTKSDYDYTKSGSLVLRDTKCADWFDKIMQTGKDVDSGLIYELTETNVFRDLQCASHVVEWEPLTDNDVWDIGVSWEEIASHNKDRK